MLDKALNKVAVVMLAAGHGKRMQSVDRPKVMHSLGGKPLIGYLSDTVQSLGFGIKPVVVVGINKEVVIDYLGDGFDYVEQAEQLGTGHAVARAESILRGNAEDVLVLYGDMPFIKTESIRQLIDEHVEKNNTLTLMTATVPDFSGWYAQFYSFGRIIRAPSGQIVNIVERKDACEEELRITELSTCRFCFKAEWLWENLKNLQNNNAQGEYYLTDLVRFAFKQEEKFSAIPLTPKEAIGVNTQDDLKIAATL